LGSRGSSHGSGDWETKRGNKRIDVCARLSLRGKVHWVAIASCREPSGTEGLETERA
jgi:hypothetical protein